MINYYSRTTDESNNPRIEKLNSILDNYFKSRENSTDKFIDEEIIVNPPNRE